jgi:hypothetical protein
MDKGIGFRRNIHLAWLDATAKFLLETDDSAELRERLEPVVGELISSRENRRMAIDILINIWVRNGERYPKLRAEALSLFANADTSSDRIWLHYGLTLLYYDFFRLGVDVLGRISRYSDEVTARDLKKQIYAELGQLGAIDKAAERIIFSLRDWGILTETERRNVYAPRRQALRTTCRDIEQWLLAAALTANPAEEIPFADLIRLPELFPFRFTVGVDELRTTSRFEVNRQGLGWDMVRLVTSRRELAANSSPLFQT